MNFKNIIQDLIAHGETEVSIAEYVGQTRQNINYLLHGRVKAPNYFVGDKLIAMHKKVMRKHPKVDTHA